MKKQQANRFGDILKVWVESLEKRSKLDEVLIERLWRKKMGTSINRYTREIKFRKGVVYLTIDSVWQRERKITARMKKYWLI